MMVIKDTAKKSMDSADEAFSTLMKYSRSLPEDFDYKAELVSAKKEGYGLTAEKSDSGRGGKALNYFTMSDKL